MTLRIVLILILLTSRGTGDFDKATYYSIFAKGSLEQINQELSGMTPMNFPEKVGYEGALKMKKASLRKAIKDRLDDFKAGNKELEYAIKTDSTNVEFRFLRLCIQENAPRFLGYHSDLDRDNLYIRLHFNQLTPVVRDAIKDYSKQSHILKLDNL